MATRDEFNVSGKVSEEQKIDLEEKARVRKTEEIVDRVSRRKAHSMMNDRDHLVDILKAQAAQKVANAVDEAVRKNVAQKAELHIKPPKGFVQDSPQQQAFAIKGRIEKTFGKELDKGIKSVRDAENKKIDDHISKSLEKERGQTRSSAPKNDQAREQAKASKDSDKKGNKPDRSPSRSRGRQRTR